jgi:hypothetical protein
MARSSQTGVYTRAKAVGRAVLTMTVPFDSSAFPEVKRAQGLMIDDDEISRLSLLTFSHYPLLLTSHFSLLTSHFSLLTGFFRPFPVPLVDRLVAMDVIIIHEYPVGRSFEVVKLTGAHCPEKRPYDPADQDQ